MSQGKFVDMVGEKYGRLTVLEVAGKSHNHYTWLCSCECGKTKVIRGTALRTGGTTSCGCYSKEISRENIKKALSSQGNAKHRMSHTGTYRIYRGMLDRCYNEKVKIYKYYGGKGIGVCERWREDFSNFLEDMGERPSEKFSLDRLDGSKGYCKDNVVWATDDQQARNRSMLSSNTTGKTGVSKVRDSYKGSYSDPHTKKVVSKHFSIRKFGEELAFKMASEWRDSKIDELRKQGAGYSENHGK